MNNSNISSLAISQELEFEHPIPTILNCVFFWALAQIADFYILCKNWKLLSFSKPLGGNLLLSTLSKCIMNLIIGVIGLLRIFAVNNNIVCSLLAIAIEGCVLIGEYFGIYCSCIYIPIYCMYRWLP